MLPARAQAPPLPARPVAAIAAAIAGAFDEGEDQAEASDVPAPKTRAVVVLKNGVVVAERYAKGFVAATPLPGWSMTKSVTSTLVGLLATAGRIDISAPVGLAEWASEGDPRGAITWDPLLRMSSGRRFPRLDANIFMASGFEGQYVVVVPNDDLVVVRLGLDRGPRIDLEDLVTRVVAAARASS